MSLSVPVRVAAVGMLAALLSGCGGGGSSSGTASYSVSVAVSGLSGTVAVAQGPDTLTFTSDGTQTFGSMLGGGSSYTVKVNAQPSTQYCRVGANGTGVIGADLTVEVTCNASAGGVWQGMSADGNDAYLAMIDEAGDFWLLDASTANPPSHEYLYLGSLSVSGMSTGAMVSGADTGQALAGSFSGASGGPIDGTGTVSGTIDPRSTLSLTSTFTASDGTQLLTQLPALAYDGTVYSSGSSLADIAGTYTQALNETGTTAALTVSISAAGTIVGQANVGGCIVNGNISPITSSYDMYSVQYTYAGCTTASGLMYLNGLTFSGMGTLEPASVSLSGKAEFIAGTRAPLTSGYLAAIVDFIAN